MSGTVSTCQAFQAAVEKRANAVIVSRGPVLNNYQKQIADLAIKNRMPLPE
jgi:hypothetical protein